jgi:hypothetical protein
MTEASVEQQTAVPAGNAGSAVAPDRPAESEPAPYTEPGHRGRTLSNHNYDLVQELSELLTGLWRVDRYLQDVGDQCNDCGKMWQDVRKQKELLIEKIRQEVVNHAKQGRFI